MHARLCTVADCSAQVLAALDQLGVHQRLVIKTLVAAPAAGYSACYHTPRTLLRIHSWTEKLKSQLSGIVSTQTRPRRHFRESSPKNDPVMS